MAKRLIPEFSAPKSGHASDEDRADALKLHLRGKVQPSPETTWDYGEHLRALGIPWCSGLWMLWATGRHSDVVGTVVTWLRDRPATKPELVDTVWHALALAARLASPTGLDQDRDFLARHLRDSSLATEAYKALWSWAEEASKRSEWPSVSRTYHAYLEREIAKIPWVGLMPLADEIQAAFDRWLTRGNSIPGNLPLDRLAQATLAVSKSGLSLAERETAVLVMIAQWLTGIEHQTQVPLYIRTIDPSYDAPYHSDIGSILPALPALSLQRAPGSAKISGASPI